MTPNAPRSIREMLSDEAAGPVDRDFDDLLERASSRSPAWGWAAVVAVAAIVGCATLIPKALSGGQASLDAAGTTTERLVGLWSVVGPGVPAGVSMKLGASLIVFSSCGETRGEWRADVGGDFLAATDSGDARCYHQDGRFAPPVLNWLNAASRYRIRSNDQVVLLDESGAVVARLRDGAHPSVSLADTAADALPPRVTPTLRTWLDSPGPLPKGISVATPADLFGKWAPAGQADGASAKVTFNQDGTWTASDGCNGSSGRYALTAGGQLLLTSTEPALVACVNESPVLVWLETCRRVGLSGGNLVLTDAQGVELGRLQSAR